MFRHQTSAVSLIRSSFHLFLRTTTNPTNCRIKTTANPSYFYNLQRQIHLNTKKLDSDQLIMHRDREDESIFVEDAEALDINSGINSSIIYTEDFSIAHDFQDFRVCNSLKAGAIPCENDLIDYEFDVPEIDMSPSPFITRIPSSDSQSYDQLPIKSHQNKNPPSSQSTSTNTKKSHNSPHAKVISKNTNKSPSIKLLKKHEREKVAKIKMTELEKAGREAGLNKSLSAYIELCVFNGQLNKALNSLNYYRQRSKIPSKEFPAVTNVSCFNSVIHGFAARGHFAKAHEVYQLIKQDNLKPTVQTFTGLLECLGRSSGIGDNLQNIEETIQNLKDHGFNLQDIFNKSVFAGNQREIVLKAVQRYEPEFQPIIDVPFLDYTCPLLCNLNGEQLDPVVSPAAGLMTQRHLEQLARKQLQIELKGNITVKSIERKDDKNSLLHFRNILSETEKEWTKAVEGSYQRNLNSLINHSMKQRSHKSINLYPFLKILNPSDCVKIILQEIRKLAEGSETYSPSMSILHRDLGARVLSRYEILYKKQNGILSKIDELYQEYTKWYLEPSQYGPANNSRQKWQQLLFDQNYTGPHVDIREKVWPNSVLVSIGRFLYGIIMKDIKIDAHLLRTGSAARPEQIVPAFYSIFRMQGVHLKEEIKPHPTLVKLFQGASRDELIFDSNLVPMICPPLPWASIRTGGYLLSAAKIVRLPYQAHQQQYRLESCLPEDLYPSLDSLNQLGSVPWKINQPVLDVVIEVFNNKGDDSLAIPPPPSECPPAPPMESTMSKQEKFKIHKQRQAVKRQKAEMYSLWCDALYKLSLANHFRNETFWFPHNMDFRGRVYPCPPHLNHLGSDVARSILVFASGQALGPKGLDWLKIHVVNLTGLKKRNSVQERLKYANDILSDILDSADAPLTGKKWWAKSEEPWQTLACCMEIAKAIRSGDPENYVSHFPVHQDGSCNGLQHYAALGRDQGGAESVNLCPSETPQDVYSAVATLVEKARVRDTENGVKIAQVLEGFVKRKVIKQTVMTTVYGVTRYGARLQIAKQLKDIAEFPKEHLWPASLYLVGRTFDSLQEMFTSTKEIQDWFTECARMISAVCAQNVEWVTPLGLPIVQPYFRPSKKSFDSYDPYRLKETSYSLDMFERPNVMKQKNAFPPNYIHSLDSSHMMLTSLHSERAKITFVSVHDCYWTHPNTVEIMNRICREQFVALHSQPILEDLSEFLVKQYSYKESDFKRDGSLIDITKTELNRTLKAVPKKGTFDLKSVLKSVYFFS